MAYNLLVNLPELNGHDKMFFVEIKKNTEKHKILVEIRDGDIIFSTVGDTLPITRIRADFNQKENIFPRNNTYKKRKVSIPRHFVGKLHIDFSIVKKRELEVFISCINQAA